MSKIKIAIETSMLDGRKAKGTAIVLSAYLNELKKYSDILDITLVHKFKSDEKFYSEYKEIVIPRVWKWKMGGFINEFLFFLKYRLDVMLKKKEMFDIYFHAHSRIMPSFVFAPGRKYMFHAMDGGPKTAGFMGESREVFPWYVRYLKRNIDCALALSIFGQKGIMKSIGFDQSKVPYIYNGVAPDFSVQNIELAREAISELYHYPAKYILCVSRWDPHKNILGTIEAYNLYKQEILKNNQEYFPLVFVGGKHMPEYSKKVDDKIVEFGLEKDIMISKFVTDEDLPKAYACAEFLVFASYYEGFGLPVVEAMKSGCPVICSNNSSLEEIGGEAALKVDPYNPKEIAQAMINMQINENLKKDLRNKGFEWANKFSWEKSTEKLVQVFKNLVQ